MEVQQVPRLLPLPLPLLLILFIPQYSCFNLEVSKAQVYTDPTLDYSSWGRESYFGFAVALQLRTSDDTAWLIVGAPRANSSHYKPRAITEPGVVFKCSLEGDTCQELYIDQTGNTVIHNSNSEFSYHDLKNGGWLGGSLDSQPTYDADRQVTAVCAPRWINQKLLGNYLMNGACYWLNESLPNAPAHKKLPLVQESLQTHGDAVFYYAHGEAGMSLHLPDDPTEMIVGAPGVYKWRGTIIRFKDTYIQHVGGIARRRRQTRRKIPEYQMFSREFVPNPYYTSAMEDFDLMGYSVTSGRFRSKDELLYVGGAPRGAGSHGKVIVFSFPDWQSQPLTVLAEWKGKQLGENFGASLVAADVNGDGLSDLIVGAPMHSLKDKPDAGRIQVFLSSQDQQLVSSDYRYHGSTTSFARFGTSLARIGDLNADGYEDVAIGAPWEGDGAVYIYLGSASGLRQAYSQKLQPQNFPQNMKGFGMGLSRGIDFDKNGYPDLAIGSFVSGHAVVLRSRPVAYITGSLTSEPPNIGLNDTLFQLSACLGYRGYKVPRYVSIKGNITLDTAFPSPRAFFVDNKSNFREVSLVATNRETECLQYPVMVKDDKVDPRKPIHMKLEYDLYSPEGHDILAQPKTEPGIGTMTMSRVGIVTGCEEDGDDACLVNMQVSSRFDRYSESDYMIIGSDNKPVLTVMVDNVGEPVFLPNLTVQVEPPLSLTIPLTHDCVYGDSDVRTSLTCRLANPIVKGGRDKIEITVDASNLGDSSSDPEISLEVSGEGLELHPLDNAVSHSLNLAAQANLLLHGYSREEQVVYQRFKKGSINTTYTPSFLHIYSIVKEGPTPLGQVEFVLDIPVNITEENFLKIYHPKASFLGEPVACTIHGGTFSVFEKKPFKSRGSRWKPKEKKKKKKEKKIATEVEEKEETVNIVDAKLEKAILLNCSNPLISCAQIRCLISTWPAETVSAEFSVRMDMNLTKLADHISAAAGAEFISRAHARILTLNPLLTFIGNNESALEVQTFLQPDRLPGRGVPWWVIVLSILGGLLLLGVTSYVLYKMGFFQRKEHEEMVAHQAIIESNGTG
ncbi:integrin alpha-PS3-like [Penaeus chinensis]|uniref:integrin alpha-PS3-like n=1 Tax=Penaeus chinensis TaxID=139456 RepID=UPI001FB631BC|nr:integrin alpha-PS3-like [Penaeus chinensis]XP_047495130.1 integrin alpha-PS3-like [Penaeus chinensis]